VASTEHAGTSKSENELKNDTQLVLWLRAAVESSADEDGWANLAAVGNRIAKQAPDFDSRNYGYVKLSDLIIAIGLFDVRKRGGKGAKVVEVRDKRQQEGERHPPPEESV